MGGFYKLSPNRWDEALMVMMDMYLLIVGSFPTFSGLSQEWIFCLLLGFNTMDSLEYLMHQCH